MTRCPRCDVLERRCDDMARELERLRDQSREVKSEGAILSWGTHQLLAEINRLRRAIVAHKGEKE